MSSIQNHDENQRNAMVSQSVLLELEVGDRVQVYMFTHTGLQDKPGNHLTQFVGFLLRPKNFLEHTRNGTAAIASTNGHSRQ